MLGGRVKQDVLVRADDDYCCSQEMHFTYKAGGMGSYTACAS